MNFLTLKKITIIIPTYNRYPYLLRLLKYYNSYNFNLNLLIIDSSSDVLEIDELKAYLARENVIHQKYDSSQLYIEKIADGIRRVDSEYVVLCADDDFIIPSSIASSSEFLDENPDYSSAHGPYFRHPNAETVKNSDFVLRKVKGRSISEESSAERLKSYLFRMTGHCYHPFYAVHRTHMFNFIWSETAKYKLDLALTELFPCCLSLIYGKMKILPVFYSSRETNNYNWLNEERFNQMFNKEKINKGIEVISSHLSEKDNTTIEEAREIVDQGIKIYENRLKERFISKKLSNKRVTEGLNDISLFHRFKDKIRPRVRIKKLINDVNDYRYKNCPESIRKNHFDDYMRVRRAVIGAGLTYEELNHSRKDSANQLSYL